MSILPLKSTDVSFLPQGILLEHKTQEMMQRKLIKVNKYVEIHIGFNLMEKALFSCCSVIDGFFTTVCV